MEEAINTKAKKQTCSYFRDNRRDDCGRDGVDEGSNNNICSNQEQVFLVYKFINTPIDLIIAGMKQMMRE